MNVNLDSGGVAVISAFVGTTTTSTYTVLAGHNSPDLSVTSITLNGTATDAVLNNLSLVLPVININTGSNIVIDTIDPVISSIVSLTPDGAYTIGANISIRINFSEMVTVNGTMTLNLDTGGVATISGFTGTNAVGIYTVLATHTSLDLTCTSVTVNGTATDLALNTLNLALPVTNIDTGSNIIIDTTAPTITSITSLTADGSYKAGSVILVRIDFSELITLTGTMGINLDSGGVAVVNAFTGTTAIGSYTVLTGENSLDLTATSITVNNTAQDIALNNLVLALPGTNINTGSNIIIDTIAPFLTSITSSTPDGTYGIGAAVNVTLSFSEQTSLVGNISVSLDSGGSVTINAFANATQASGTYTVAALQNSLDLSATLITVLGTSSDAAGNLLVTALPVTNINTGSNIVIDTFAPSITSITSITVNGTYSLNDTIDITVNFSEPVTLIGTMDIALDSGGSVSISAFANATQASGTYTVLMNHNSLDLNATGVVINGTARDAGLNDLILSMPVSNLAVNKDLLVDALPASILSITSITPNGAYSIGALINVRVIFSEIITLNGTLTVSLDTGQIVEIGPFFHSSIGSGIYTVIDGDTSADLDSVGITLTGTASDTAFNGVIVTLPASTIAVNKDIIIDTTAPFITSIQSLSPDGYYSLGEAINIAVTFSGPVTLASGTLSLNLTSGGTVQFGPFAGTAAVGVYTVLAGENTNVLDAIGISLTGGPIVDIANNVCPILLPATTISPLNTLVVDSIAPTITSSALSASNLFVDVTFTEGMYTNVLGTGSVAVGDFSVVFAQNGGTATNASVLSVTNTTGGALVGGEATIRLNLTIVGLPSGVETITITPNFNAMFDRAGNAAPTTTTTTAITLFDQAPPVITNITSDKANGVYKENEIINVQVTFNEVVYVTGDAVRSSR